MAALITLKVSNRAFDVLIFCNGHAGINPLAQAVIGRLGHLPSSLPYGRQNHLSRKRLVLQRPSDSLIRQYGPSRLADDLPRVMMQSLIHTVFPAFPIFSASENRLFLCFWR